MEAADGEFELQKLSDDPESPPLSDFSPRYLTIVGALVSFVGVLSFSFAVLCDIFKGRRRMTKPQKPAGRAPGIKESSQLEDMENAYDMDDWGNEHAPTFSVVRKSVQSQSTHEPEEDHDVSSDPGWQNDSWCNDEWSDAEATETCQPFGDEILEAAIVAGRSAKPSSNALPPKGKAD